MATHLTRRALLGLLAGGAAWSLSGCRMPANPLQAPPTPVPIRPTHVALVINNAMPAPQKQAALAAYQEAADAVAAKGLTIDRQITAIPVSAPTSAAGDVAAALVGGAASGAPSPDLLILGQSSSLDPTYLLQQLVAATLLRPIDAELRRAPASDTQDYVPNTLDTCRLAGKLYGLPLGVDPLLLLVDADLLRAAALDTPGNWGWPDLVNACQKLTRAPGQYAAIPETFFLEVFLWQHGAAVLSPDGRHSTLDTPAAIEVATFYGQLFTSDKIVAPQVPNIGGWTSAPGQPLSYNTARIAMVTSGNEPPKRPLEYSEPFHDRQRATFMFLDSALAMAARTPDPAQAFTAMTALATELQRRTYVPARRGLVLAQKG
jgi:ABC-type glycerol-3-phosphate transport system substrate-binding protein